MPIPPSTLTLSPNRHPMCPYRKGSSPAMPPSAEPPDNPAGVSQPGPRGCTPRPPPASTDWRYPTSPRHAEQAGARQEARPRRAFRPQRAGGGHPCRARGQSRGGSVSLPAHRAAAASSAPAGLRGAVGGAGGRPGDAREPGPQGAKQARATRARGQGGRRGHGHHRTRLLKRVALATCSATPLPQAWKPRLLVPSGVAQ